MQMYFWAWDQLSGSRGSLVGVGTRALPEGSSLGVPMSVIDPLGSAVAIGTRVLPFSASWSRFEELFKGASFSDMVKDVCGGFGQRDGLKTLVFRRRSHPDDLI